MQSYTCSPRSWSRRCSNPLNSEQISNGASRTRDRSKVARGKACSKQRSTSSGPHVPSRQFRRNALIPRATNAFKFAWVKKYVAAGVISSRSVMDLYKVLVWKKNVVGRYCLADHEQACCHQLLYPRLPGKLWFRMNIQADFRRYNKASNPCR